MKYQDAVSELITQAETMFEPEIGKLLITPLCICESAAGFYLGWWCLEYMGEGSWCPQPYDRAGMYMTLKDAEKAYQYEVELEKE